MPEIHQTESIQTELEIQQAPPDFLQRADYIPYNLNEAKRADLGRERGQFEEWEQMSFETFAQRDEFQSAEAVVGYFLDHPQVHIQDALVNLLIEGKYERFLTTHFNDETKLNPRGLAFEIDKVVSELMAQRQEIIESVVDLNAKTSTVIEKYLGFPPPPFDERKLLFVPSADVYNFMAHGLSSAQLNNLGMGSLGITTYPRISPDQTPPSRVGRIGFVPLAFELKIETTKITLTSAVKMPTATDQNDQKWKNLAIKIASHESEHTRVHGKFDPEENEFTFGFKLLPNVGNLRQYPRQQLIDNKTHDEGMTDFISVWKQNVASGQLNIDSSFEEIVNQIKGSDWQTGGYSPDISHVIKDMNQFEELSHQSPLSHFLESYYFSLDYPA